MNKPMTAKQAHMRFLCPKCREGIDCGKECVLSETCSFRCPSCKNIIYFQGDTWNVPRKYECPNCGKIVPKHL
jgi:predicted RNA-binding Zn-ribbon protein involved in translation (DUF1610 family)